MRRTGTTSLRNPKKDRQSKSSRCEATSHEERTAEKDRVGKRQRSNGNKSGPPRGKDPGQSPAPNGGDERGKKSVSGPVKRIAQSSDGGRGTSSLKKQSKPETVPESGERGRPSPVESESGNQIT